MDEQLLYRMINFWQHENILQKIENIFFYSPELKFTDTLLKIININLDINDTLITNVFKLQSKNKFSNTLLKVLQAICNYENHFSEFKDFKNRFLIELNDLEFTISQIKIIFQETDTNQISDSIDFYENDIQNMIDNVKIFTKNDSSVILENEFANDISFFMFRNFLDFDRLIWILEKLDQLVTNINQIEKSFDLMHKNQIMDIVLNFFDRKIYQECNNSLIWFGNSDVKVNFYPENDRIKINRTQLKNVMQDSIFLKQNIELNQKIDKYAQNQLKEYMHDFHLNDALLIDMKVNGPKNVRSFKYSCIQINESNINQKVMLQNYHQTMYKKISSIIQDQQFVKQQNYEEKIHLFVKYNMKLFDDTIQTKEKNHIENLVQIYHNNYNLQNYITYLIESKEIDKYLNNKFLLNFYKHQLFPNSISPLNDQIIENKIDIDNFTVNVLRHWISLYKPIIVLEFEKFSNKFGQESKIIKFIHQIFSSYNLFSKIKDSANIKHFQIEILNLIGYELQSELEFDKFISYVIENIDSLINSGPNNIRFINNLILSVKSNLISKLVDIIVSNPEMCQNNTISSDTLVLIYKKQSYGEVTDKLQLNTQFSFYQLLTSKQAVNYFYQLLKNNEIDELMYNFIVNNEEENINCFIKVFVHDSGQKRIKQVSLKQLNEIQNKLQTILQYQIHFQEKSIQNQFIYNEQQLLIQISSIN